MNYNPFPPFCCVFPCLPHQDAGGKSAPAPKKSVAVKLPAITADDVSGFKAAYDAHVAERATQGIPPLPLDAKQVR